jgi:hypothetical protein
MEKVIAEAQYIIELRRESRNGATIKTINIGSKSSILSI